ncbi:hypothetical protein SprV_0200622700 [Sparganum proliferum]
MEKDGGVCHPHQSDVLLLLLLGLPGAGKSSCARRLTARLNVFNYLIVAFDDNLLFEFESPHRSQWKDMRSEILCSVRRLIEAWNTDQFNSTCAHLTIQKPNRFKTGLPSMRKDYFRLSRDQKCRFATVSFNLPLDVCKERNSYRDCPVPDSVLTRMHSRFEWPDENAHPWEQNNLEITSPDPDLDAIESFLWRVYTTPVVYLDLNQMALERQRDREINEASETHRLDTVLRALVRNCILSLPLELQARYGKSLNETSTSTMTHSASGFLVSLKRTFRRKYLPSRCVSTNFTCCYI